LGGGAGGVIVFAYHLTDPWDQARFGHVFTWRGRDYAFLCVRLCDYVRYGRNRYANWHARNIPRELFRSLARPAVEVFFDETFDWSPAFEEALI
jgi:hypothetical protein